MSSVVLKIDSDIPKEELKFLVSTGNFKYIHVNHSSLKGGVKENIISLSRKNKDIKSKLVLLANENYFLYVLRDGISSFVHKSTLANLWQPIINNEYLIDKNGLVYQYSPAKQAFNKKLLVVFSQTPPDPHSSSLARYFPTSFSNIDKHVGDNVSILRVADIGGICGSFYLNSIGLPENESNIQSLISDVCHEYNIDAENVILYGESKGATGSLYHGIIGNYKSICVDPILDDEHYINKLNDFYMIEGVFPEKKKGKFTRLLESISENEIPEVKIITSESSEQYNAINELFKGLSEKVLILNSLNDNIKSHPDVAPNSIHAITTLINMTLLGIRSKNEHILFV
ncbi:XcbB/CpsF family capsular polysaccharide biosynthesis protein [Candidatus Pantoea multigeneris]|uniref:XcbB/CpsF family capsular polysaccharide biosynthesis protein n=1 Tax=Candidatus Pantoea multigeneris TaxID=2608357 RepID=A0ABX0RCI1_9GAMM|nr:XcbB/CpsF family capsular polysaccharide biosynthesis protein [Pantoea multigeneris]NIF21179.1 XcbB/CpsF family capsular polysaccharide biosynthesis protein [Pantoea multigeneris]